MGYIIRRLGADDGEEWTGLRAALWPACPPEKHRAEMEEILRNPHEAALGSVDEEGHLQGFIELALRPYADGCASRPVGYIEGWYVEPGARRQGVGRALVRAAEEWARAQGCAEMASDAEAENHVSRAAHVRLGYREVATLVHFCKDLTRP